MNTARGWLAVLVTGVLCAALAPAQVMYVTGLSDTRAATLERAAGEPQWLAMGLPLRAGMLHIYDGKQLMLFDGGSAAMIINGPSDVELGFDPGTRAVTLTLVRGGMLIECDRALDNPWRVVVTGPTGDAPRMTFAPAPGRTYVHVTDAEATVGFASLDGEVDPLPVRIGDQQAMLDPGDRLVIAADGTRRTAALGDWPTEVGLSGKSVEGLGIASAREARAEIEGRLFDDIILWDRRAGAGYVTRRLREPPFRPEIRQVVQAVRTTTTSTQTSSQIQTQPFNAANEVPPLSPAAASVQNIGQGVTVITLNANAADLLRATGSRGLGFRGPARLAIPGFTGGLRTIGPPGLGATEP